MKVLFLDVDGVLNNHNSRSLYAISRPAARLLRHVINETDCKVVLSSTWRKFPAAVRKFCRRTRITPIDATPILWHGVRGYEIKDWLDRHPEVSHYAIVDDDSDMLPGQAPYFVKTTNETGLTTHHAHLLIHILNGSPIRAGFQAPVFGEYQLDMRNAEYDAREASLG